MVRGNLICAAAVLAASLSIGATPAPNYDNPPPGTAVQDVTAYLSGEGMNSAWHVVTSRTQHQWYVSFYAPSANGLKLAYRLPRDNDKLLAKVVKAKGADMYFPHADVRIAGAAELEKTGVQDVVLQIHQIGADCGMADVAVFGADSQMNVRPRAHVQNPCDLQASVVKNGSLAAVQLQGPYYAPSAALCCPTKPHVTALLSFQNGSWTVRPRYFESQTIRR